jgi:hypothetical protein
MRWLKNSPMYSGNEERICSSVSVVVKGRVHVNSPSIVPINASQNYGNTYLLLPSLGSAQHSRAIAKPMR